MWRVEYTPTRELIGPEVWEPGRLEVHDSGSRSTVATTNAAASNRPKGRTGGDSGELSVSRSVGLTTC